MLRGVELCRALRSLKKVLRRGQWRSERERVAGKGGQGHKRDLKRRPEGQGSSATWALASCDGRRSTYRPPILPNRSFTANLTYSRALHSGWRQATGKDGSGARQPEQEDARGSPSDQGTRERTSSGESTQGKLPGRPLVCPWLVCPWLV